MKDRPILFSGEMVRAILEGRKTQTRRVFKDQPCVKPPYFFAQLASSLGYPGSEENVWAGFRYPAQDYGASSLFVKCPYGKPGDRIWVRETWNYCWYGTSETNCVRFAAGGKAKIDVPQDFPYPRGIDGKYRPSIHMPRWASRITLEITNIRVERLNDISEEDAKAEGYSGVCKKCVPPDSCLNGGKLWFYKLWESINGAGSWEENPWVWVIEFKRIAP